jgi:hypothetical protein
MLTVLPGFMVHDPKVKGNIGNCAQTQSSLKEFISHIRYYCKMSSKNDTGNQDFLCYYVTREIKI